jgi:hypothetical protein
MALERSPISALWPVTKEPVDETAPAAARALGRSDGYVDALLEMAGRRRRRGTHAAGPQGSRRRSS